MSIRSDEREAVVAAYQQGASGPEIAASRGVSISTIYAWLKSAGVACRQPLGYQPMTPAQRHRVEVLLAKGAPVAQIASEVGVHRSTVYRIRTALREASK